MEYDAVRRAEERGSADPTYYRALPFRDLSGKRVWDWRIRAVSYVAFLRRVVEPLEAAVGRTLRIADLGAGNAWLSHRLAQRGHSLAAVDLRLGRDDGLGAHVHYGTAFLPIQAEFDRLPFVAGQIQIAVFNASFHYSTDYEVTLTECLRVLEPQGTIVILDTPIYRESASGRTMVCQREAEFEKAYGFPSTALASENFLTWDRIRELGSAVGLEWRVVRPWYGLSWALRPWAAKLRGEREPAQFVVLVGRRSGMASARRA